MVSVIVPLYNKAPHIERTVRSVLNQSVQDFELIVVDDGSTDGGADIVRTMKDPRIQLVQQKNAGVSAARNRGIVEARGEMVAFLDADDEWKPMFLETILRLKERYPEAGLYATAYEIKRFGVAHPARLRAVPPQPWEGILPNYFKAATLGDPPVCASAVGIPKKILAEIGGFPVGCPLGEDVDVWGKIALKYAIAFHWSMGAVYNQDALNRACRLHEGAQSVPFVATARRLIERNEVPLELLFYLKEYVAKKELELVRRKVLSGDPQARSLLRLCKPSLPSLKREKLFWQLFAALPFEVTALVFRGKWLFIRSMRSLQHGTDASQGLHTKPRQISSGDVEREES